MFLKFVDYQNMRKMILADDSWGQKFRDRFCLRFFIDKGLIEL